MHRSRLHDAADVHISDRVLDPHFRRVAEDTKLRMDARVVSDQMSFDMALGHAVW